MTYCHINAHITFFKYNQLHLAFHYPLYTVVSQRAWQPWEGKNMKDSNSENLVLQALHDGNDI